jgi:autotransporter-associated beta strand protein
VNTLQVGVQGSASANNGTNFATGTVTVMVGTLSVNSSLQLGVTAGGPGVPATRGGVNLNNSAVLCVNSISAGAGTNNTIGINVSTLFLTNTAGPGINTFSVSNATVNLRVTGGTPPILVTNLVTGSLPSTINIVSLPAVLDNPAQFPLIKYTGSIGGAGFNFTLGPLPPALVCGGFLSNNLANQSVDVVLTNCATPDAFLTWNGDVSGDWDSVTPNWQNNIGPGLEFSPGNAVVFNDAASGGTTVNLVGTLTPSSIVVSNQANAYSLTGLGQISGAGSLTKRGPGMLTVANSGVNDFTGGVAIESGTLQVGAGDADGNLPDGNVTNNSSLVFNLSEDTAVNSVISGAGTVAQIGPNELTLNGANTFTGATIINAGTLRAGNSAALGAVSGPTFVTNSGTLDVNGFNLGAEPITVSGTGVTNLGAVINTGPQQISALRLVTLAGNATFGGTGRWDIRNTGGTASLLTGGQPFTITKIGTNQVSLVGVNPIDGALGDINVQEGVFAIQTSTTQVGDSNKTITIFGGATLNVYRLTNNPLNKRLVFQDGAMMYSENDSNVIVGPVTLAGDVAFNVNSAGGAPALLFVNALSGAGGLTKTGLGPLILAASNSYSGRTWISTGAVALIGAGSISSSSNITIAAGATLDARGRGDGTLNLAPGQTLNGNGAINGNLTVQTGATVSPGTNVIGTLTVSGGVTLNGVTFMKLNRSALTNDVLQTGAGMTYGGTLTLSNISGVLQAGNNFKLFAATNYAGGFSNLAPVIPASGLKWDTTGLNTSGTLRILTAPPVITSVSLLGAALVLAGTNGAIGGNYFVLATTNLSSPLSSWERVATNVFDGAGNFIFTNAVNPAVPERYYLLQLP